MFILSKEEAEKAEKIAQKRFNLSVLGLVKKAGKAVFEEARKVAAGKEVVVVAGKGNNGSDGLVAADLLLDSSYKVHLFTLFPFEELREETGRILKNFKKISPIFLTPQNFSQFKEVLKKSSLIIDAIFGFGFKGKVEGFVKDAISAINESGVPVLSIDLPSGLEANTGKIGGVCVKATKTVTFTAPKVGEILYPGCEYAGEIVVKNIGISEEIVKEVASIKVFEKEELRKNFPPLRKDAHKKERGKVLVIAGSLGMTGAAFLTSQAALKIGAGLVVLGVPQSLNPVFEAKLTEVMTLPLVETDAQTLSAKALDKIKEVAPSFDLLIVGPGLSRHTETVSLVRKLIEEISMPLVLDADGLNALVGADELLLKFSAPCVITPHPGELARLMNSESSVIQEERVSFAKEASERWQIVVVLKGYRSVVSSPEGTTAINLTGGPALATAGTGDVLTGIIGGLMAQGVEAYEAAVLGTYLHGLAGDLAASSLTDYCVVAGDLLEYLPLAVKNVLLDEGGLKDG